MSTSSQDRATCWSSRLESEANSGSDLRRVSSMWTPFERRWTDSLRGVDSESTHPDSPRRAEAVGTERVVDDPRAIHARPGDADALAVDGLTRRRGVRQQRACDGVEL